MTHPYDLERIVTAQAAVYESALAEIRGGAKRSHWMWFIFPQIAGLGESPMAQHYAIVSLEEARAYLAHPVLGARLRQCVEALGALTPAAVSAPTPARLPARAAGGAARRRPDGCMRAGSSVGLR